MDTAVANPAEAAPVEDAVVDVAAPANEAPATEVQPSETQPAEPDWNAILSREDALDRILKDERVAKEIAHRASSEAGRRAKAERDRFQREYEQRIAQEQAEARRKADLEGDPYEVGTRYQENLKREQERQAIVAEMLGNLRMELETGMLSDVELTPEDAAKINPMQFRRFAEYSRAVRDLVTNKRAQELAEKMVKERLPKEVEAGVAEYLSKQRKSERGAQDLPAGTAATFQSANDVNVAFINGELGPLTGPGALKTRQRYDQEMARFGGRT